MLAALVAGLLAAGCAGGDDTASSGSDDDERPPIDGVELEPGTDPGSADEVARDVEALLDTYSRTVSAIVADPTVVDDPGHQLVRDYVALFEPDSPIVADALAGWARMATDGATIRPVNGDRPALVTRLQGEVELVADGEARFATCDEHHYVTYDAGGAPTDIVETTLLHGEGVAVRAAEGWLLRDLRNIMDGQGCPTGSDTGSEQ